MNFCILHEMSEVNSSDISILSPDAAACIPHSARIHRTMQGGERMQRDHLESMHTVPSTSIFPLLRSMFSQEGQTHDSPISLNLATSTKRDSQRRGG